MPVVDLSAEIGATAGLVLGDLPVLFDGQVEVDVLRAKLLLEELLNKTDFQFSEFSMRVSTGKTGFKNIF